jgi:lysyl-tRNA synthetase, class II
MPDDPNLPDPTPDLLATRHAKAEALHAAGVPPFGSSFEVDGDVAGLRAQFADGKVLRGAGRLTAHRDMGKSHFLDLADLTGRIQIYFQAKAFTPEEWNVFQQLDLGDFVGVEGECFTTRTGEPTIRVNKFRPLAKSLRPLPDKWHGLADVEQRYRQRYLDLVANPESRRVFLARTTIMRAIREFLQERGFLEVETPMLQMIASGAAAKPFQTRHNALATDLFLRIAPELYLKRLLVAGMPKVFELNRNFRNEGISRRHNPEFTMLEAYWAYADFERMADLVEELICHLSTIVNGTLELEHKDAEGNVIRRINLTRPWKRARYRDLITGVAGEDWFSLDLAGKRERAIECGVQVSAELAEHEITQQVFEKLIEEKTLDPLYVTHLPKELVPLAKQNAADDSLVDVYELIINGQEISPGYTELNDPRVQRARLLAQAGDEQVALDEDFLLALEHGMPPAGGIGIGIDRLVMMLTGAESIRDVILFPHMKPKA